MPCPIYASLGKVNHMLSECRFMDDFKKDPTVGWKSKKSKKYDKKDNKDDEDDDDMSISSDDDAAAKKKKPYPKVKESLVCFVGTPSAKADKAEMRELNATMPDVPQYLNWSEATITWDRSDHPVFLC